MRIKTIFLLVVTVLLTIVIMQNSDPVIFKILFWQAYISKLVIMAAIAIISFVLGIIVGRPRKAKFIAEPAAGVEPNEALSLNKKPLSDEDRDYIN